MSFCDDQTTVVPVWSAKTDAIIKVGDGVRRETGLSMPLSEEQWLAMTLRPQRTAKSEASLIGDPVRDAAHNVFMAVVAFYTECRDLIMSAEVRVCLSDLHCLTRDPRAWHEAVCALYRAILVFDRDASGNAVRDTLKEAWRALESFGIYSLLKKGGAQQ